MTANLLNRKNTYMSYQIDLLCYYQYKLLLGCCLLRDFISNNFPFELQIPLLPKVDYTLEGKQLCHEHFPNKYGKHNCSLIYTCSIETSKQSVRRKPSTST